MEVAIAHAGISLAAFAVMARAEYRFARKSGLTVMKRTLAQYAVLSLIPVVNLVLAVLMLRGAPEPDKPFFEDGVYPRDD